MLQPIEAFKLSIEKWEGGFQADPADSGNWVEGKLIGTQRGVTPGAWAQFLNRPVRDITPQMMKAISLTDAARVYEQNYYRGPGFNKFTWGPTIDVAADVGWGSGPVRGIKALQLLAGTAVDGVVGPKTVAAHSGWVGHLGPARAVEAFYNWRCGWYRQICLIRPANNKFLKGWLNRAKWQSTSSPWWQAWSAAPSIPAPQPESVPSAPERQAIESIPERDLDAMANKALEALLLVDPTLARALNVLRGLFG